MVAPFVIRPLVRVLSWPLRWLFPVEGRLAADAARSDPGRTAATATALMIGLALVVAVNSLGSSFLKSISDEFDRSFARDLTVQPHGFAPGQGPQQTIAKGLREPPRPHPRGEVVARERFLFTHRPAGVAERRRARTASCWGSPRRSTSRWTRPTSRAPRARRCSPRMARGWVTIGRGWADETGLGVGDPITLRGPVGNSPDTRVAGVVDTVVFGGQTVSMSLRTMRDVYGVTADSELALKATSAAARPVLRRPGGAHRQSRLPEPGRALQRGAQVEGRGSGEPAVRDLLRDRRRGDLRQPVRDRQHADDVRDRAHPRDRRPAGAGRLSLAGPPHRSPTRAW